MHTYIKIPVNFQRNPKVAKLKRKLGAEGVCALLTLWCFVAESFPSGDITGLDVSEIENAAGWSGAQGLFYTTITDPSCLWIVKSEGSISIKNWHKHQSHLKTYRPGKRIGGKTWQKLKRLIFKRDNYTCQYCGAENVTLECDHFYPIALGGDNSDRNLVTACVPCNRAKGKKLIPLGAM